jgi:hypothetical protein
MYSRIIKVGDLLTKPGSEDIITRTSQPIDTIPNITDDKLDLRFKITAVNHNEVWITILWLKAAFHETCDYSGIAFIRPLRIAQEDNEVLRFAIPSNSKNAVPEDDEVYPINSRDNTIQFLEPLTQLIKLYEPVSMIAPWYVFPEEEENNDILNVNNVIFK